MGDEIVNLLHDEEKFPLDVRLLVIVSSVLAGSYSNLMNDYANELPPNTDVLVLEPVQNTCAAGSFFTEESAVMADWQGFIYRGGPRRLARFYSRWELPGIEPFSGC